MENYIQLFQEAEVFLHQNGYSDIVIQDINDYFAHMRDFFDKSGWKFVMFATEEGVINEKPLEINLDARTISVPSAVATCAGVQKDQLAEMLVFEVDRFFDYMDLSNTNIYVQWKNAIAEGDTRIAMIDFASKPGKMLFAWPLTEDVTQAAGPVKFSVRFFRQNAAGEAIYSLNTQEATINIKPALAADLNDLLIEPILSGMFENVILNSQNAAAGRSAPHAPRFDAPGADISLLTVDEDGNYVVSALEKVGENYITGLANDTVSLCAQAYVTDLGELEYKWNYSYPIVNDDGEVSMVSNCYTIEDEESLVRDVYIPLSAERLEALQKQGAKPETNERYYIEVTKNNVVGYEYYPLTGDNFPIEEDTVLYERYTAFTIPATLEGEEPVEVVGKYRVTAINHKGELSTENNPVYSSVCELPGPAEIVIKNDLNNSYILSAEKDNVLAVELPENIYNADITYNWMVKKTADGEFVPVTVQLPIAGEGEEITYEEVAVDPVAELNVFELGWYRADIVSVLNRKSVTKSTKECKVTNAPAAPVLTNGMENGENYYVVKPEQSIELIVNATVTNSTNQLYSEGIEYQWFIGNNGPIRALTEADKNIAVASGNKLTVYHQAKYGGMSFDCLAYNVLNGEKTPSEHLSESFFVNFEND